MTRLPLGSSPIDIAGPATNWWDDVNESVQWQDGIFYSLCASYALVSAVALVILSFSSILFFCEFDEPSRVWELKWYDQSGIHDRIAVSSSCYKVKYLLLVWFDVT